MANGFTFVTGVNLSTGTLLVGGLVLVTGLWLLSKKDETATMMSPAAAEQQVYGDIYRAAAYPAQISQNHDRIRAAIQRIRDQFRTSREAFHKKIRDLVKARREGTITNEQFRAQIRLAITEYHNAIRLRHKEIMAQLRVPRAVGQSGRDEERPPTVP